MLACKEIMQYISYTIHCNNRNWFIILLTFISWNMAEQSHKTPVRNRQNIGPCMNLPNLSITLKKIGFWYTCKVTINDLVTYSIIWIWNSMNSTKWNFVILESFSRFNELCFTTLSIFVNMVSRSHKHASMYQHIPKKNVFTKHNVAPMETTPINSSANATAYPVLVLISSGKLRIEKKKINFEMCKFPIFLYSRYAIR